MIDRSIATPAFLVDLERTRANCARMLQKARDSGVGFRPHVKTHKTIEGARLQHGGPPGPITVSTLAEAEFFADAGFDDITYAVPIAPQKLGRCARLMQRVRHLNLLADSDAALNAIVDFHAAEGVVFDLYLKVDCGYHRAGIDPDASSSFDLAKRMARSSDVRFRGVLTHAGHSYHARSRDEVVRIAAEEFDAVDRFAKRLLESGIDSVTRSIGSTPTTAVVEKIPPADEVRPGNYIFFDAFQATLGSCSVSDCSATVLTTVIGTYPHQNKLLVDAGALALSKDLGPDHIDSNCGYGIVCDEGMNPLPMKIDRLSQEHGQVSGETPIDFSRFDVGSRLRIIPNHSCLTAAMYEVFHVVSGAAVVGEWRPVRGW